jgi:hypothetical protein
MREATIKFASREVAVAEGDMGSPEEAERIMAEGMVIRNKDINATRSP